jgi:hypothetical protein
MAFIFTAQIPHYFMVILLFGAYYCGGFPVSILTPGPIDLKSYAQFSKAAGFPRKPF